MEREGMLPLVAKEYADWCQVWAPAKVNLYLRVVGKRPDGFHELATYMLPIPLYDVVLARPADRIFLQCDDPTLPIDSGNLVWKAAGLLASRHAPGRGAELELRKRIPHQAGLGGGSSDAAATLVCLNYLWKLNLEPEALKALALELGSDVPFFLGDGPAWCGGRGEVLTPVAPAFGIHLVVVKPGEGLGTREIFQRLGAGNLPSPGEKLAGAGEKADQAFQNALKQTVSALGKTLANDLEVPSCQLLPSLEQIRGELLAAGVSGVVMTGSGSAMVALAADASKAVSVAQRLKTARTPSGPVAVYVACSAAGECP